MFLFKGRCLRISRQQKPKGKTNDQPVKEDSSDVTSFEITNVHYGTFIRQATMNNIIGADVVDAFGLIAHRPLINEGDVRLYLRIDTRARKFSIIVSLQSLSGIGPSANYAFEWSFSV